MLDADAAIWLLWNCVLLLPSCRLYPIGAGAHVKGPTDLLRRSDILATLFSMSAKIRRRSEDTKLRFSCIGFRVTT
ncbi:hypothetical protein SCHPADRAFT_493759 [Schizopora paradoxa]|uniref:Secreted protein n=1 Tax=Schizopora paradoxa TaxID=27342 RepID=A0A0H2RNF5_9AGAM|nr:hypothetical protein SCHPADRAFT_493759 [Schizopora paradoxa]